MRREDLWYRYMLETSMCKENSSVLFHILTATANQQQPSLKDRNVQQNIGNFHQKHTVETLQWRL